MTKLPDTQRLATILTDRYGLALKITAGAIEDGIYVDLHPADVHRNEGFYIRTVLGWRHVRATLHIGQFASDLLKVMATERAQEQYRFSAILALVSENGGRVSMVVNGVPVEPDRTDTWPTEWKSISCEVERGPLMIDHENSFELENAVILWGGSLLGIVITLLPSEEFAVEEPIEARGLPEGARQRVEVNRYERNPINRTLCFSRHGVACIVCGFDFLKSYGELGREFIHVHHVVPVSRLGPNYVIDPSRDLVPVCPNCHAMLHRRDPPLTVAELRDQINDRNIAG